MIQVTSYFLILEAFKNLALEYSCVMLFSHEQIIYKFQKYYLTVEIIMIICYEKEVSLNSNFLISICYKLIMTIIIKVSTFFITTPLLSDL